MTEDAQFLGLMFTHVVQKH